MEMINKKFQDEELHFKYQPWVSKVNYLYIKRKGKENEIRLSDN